MTSKLEELRADAYASAYAYAAYAGADASAAYATAYAYAAHVGAEAAYADAYAAGYADGYVDAKAAELRRLQGGK